MTDSMCNGLGRVIGLLETNDFADDDILGIEDRQPITIVPGIQGYVIERERLPK